MRIRRLDLERYGRFTDLSLDFGEAPEGPDLHLVYGPNEAGKSTIFTAFLDLLYGMHPQSPYNFLHAYSAMRVGAALEIGGTTREFVRIKRSSNSLLGADDRPIAESMIQAELGGIGREAYKSKFSLDDDSLEVGGKAILESRGDLGEILFSATSGLAELSRRLGDVGARADGYYRYRANQGELIQLKAKLADLKGQREAIDMVAGQYRRLVETSVNASEAYDAAVKGRGISKARLDRIVASISALPRLAALRDASAQLETLRSLPPAPHGWIEDVPILQTDTVRLATLAQSTAADIERLDGEIAKIEPDGAALKVVDRVELLAGARARAVTARKDVPERRLTLRAIDATIAGILSRLDRDGEKHASRLVLSAVEVGGLQSLIEARSGIDAALASARDEYASALRSLAEARAKTAEVPGEATKSQARLSALPRALKIARASDHANRARTAERAVAKALRQTADAMDGLQPFMGLPEDLLRIEIPTKEIMEGWRDRISGLETERAQLVARHAALGRDIVRLDAERKAIVGTQGDVSEGQLAALRMAREKAWAHHRSILEGDSADVFEHAMRRDDVASGRRVSAAADQEKVRQMEQAAATAAFDRDAVTGRIASLGGEREAIAAEVASAWRKATGDATAPRDLRVFGRWSELREAALTVRSALLEAQADLDEATADASVAMRDLQQALSAALIPFTMEDGFETLVSIGQDAVDAETRLSGLRSKEAECARDVASRQVALAVATADEAEWRRAWKEACNGCWLGDGGGEPGLAMVKEALATVAPLGAALETRAALEDRINKMERDLVAFALEANEFAQEIDEARGDDAFEVAGRVESRVARAVSDLRNRQKLVVELENASKKQRDITEQAVVVADRVEDMTARYNVADLVTVFERLRDVGRRSTLEKGVGAMEREISDLLGVADFADAQRLLDAVDRDALERERGELNMRLEDEDKLCHELYAASSGAKAKIAAIGADEAVAAIEEKRRTTLLEIEDGARRYLRLKSGIVAMEHALRLHRDRSRGTMITEASDAFATMSRGAYPSLATQPHKDKDKLIAMKREGGSKAADELSKGTRFQLYLALRVAGYLESARGGRSVPFIGDDIMESFDDFRAEETLKLFTKMAGVGQVIYFTHHRHIIPIARETCPTITVHELTVAERSAA